MAHALRFRAMLAELGLPHPDAAQLLHVSLRTLQNWLSGRHEVPYAAYKLLRLMRYIELPGEAWAGWHFSRGHLVTPEGRTISGRDGAWWSLLVRQAHSFGEMYRERVPLLAELSALRDPQRGCVSVPIAGVAASDDSTFAVTVPVTPHFSLMHETFPQKTRLPKAAFSLPVYSFKTPFKGVQP